MNNCHWKLIDNFDRTEFCVEECPVECDYSLFTFKTQSFYFENVTNILVYFNNLRYTEISEIPKTTPTDMLALVGGTLGLFLGISLLSFIEIVDFLIEVVWLTFQT